MLALRMKKAVRKGATLVVADPRKIWLTKLAKRHLQLRPGTDVWLLNAIMHVILDEGLQNEEYIAKYTEDFDATREVVSRYTPEEAEKVTGVPAEDIRWVARAYATERHAAIFYTLGITEHACAIDNIWSLSNLTLMTGHLGYESTGLNALRGQNNVQGLNDAGANPAYLPGYQPANDPEVVARFEARWGEGAIPASPGYRLDQMISGLHDDRIKAFYLIGENPAHTEPNASHVEEGLEDLEFLGLARHLPHGHGSKARRCRLSRLELRREGRNVHEHGAPREPRAEGSAAARQCPRGPPDRARPGESDGCRLAGVPRGPRTCGTSSPTWRRSGAASGTRGSRRSGSSGRVSTRMIPVPRSYTRRTPRARAAAASSIRSSTSRRSRSPTPSTRSSFRPGGRSTTTTRRR